MLPGGGSRRGAPGRVSCAASNRWSFGAGGVAVTDNTTIATKMSLVETSGSWLSSRKGIGLRDANAGVVPVASATRGFRRDHRVWRDRDRHRRLDRLAACKRHPDIGGSGRGRLTADDRSCADCGLDRPFGRDLQTAQYFAPGWRGLACDLRRLVERLRFGARIADRSAYFPNPGACAKARAALARPPKHHHLQRGRLFRHFALGDRSPAQPGSAGGGWGGQRRRAPGEYLALALPAAGRLAARDPASGAAHSPKYLGGFRCALHRRADPEA